MADMKPQGTPDYAVESGYEAGDANVRSVIVGVVIVLSSTFVVMAAMFALFNTLNNRLNQADEQVPAAIAQKLVPPEPRLLPSPYTDTHPEAAIVARALGEEVESTTPDPLPWDKRTYEIEQQYVESNSFSTMEPQEAARASAGRTGFQVDEESIGTGLKIPVERAMTLYANEGANLTVEGGSPINPDARNALGGTPAIMPWQPEYPNLIAGDRTLRDGNSIILDEGRKKAHPSIFDDRPEWETQDEKFSVDASGGRSLRPERLGK